MAANVAFRTRFSDLCYGYNAFWTVCAPYLELNEPGIEVSEGDDQSHPDVASAVRPRWGDGFEIETLINVRVSAVRMAVSEVASFESSRLHDDIYDRSIDVQILRLRRKIEESPNQPTLIRTERGAGYYLDATVETV